MQLVTLTKTQIPATPHSPETLHALGPLVCHWVGPACFAGHVSSILSPSGVSAWVGGRAADSPCPGSPTRRSQKAFPG